MSDLQGLELSRRFHGEVVAPWLAAHFPYLRLAAALNGAGSEVLGFDDGMSQDHDWGPRLLIFVSEPDFATHAEALVTQFADAVPPAFLGAPTAFAGRSRPLPNEPGARGDARHGLEVWTLEAQLRHLLALVLDEPLDALGWLALPEQRLLAFTAGAVFRDDDGHLTAARARLAQPPRDVQLYKLACQWRRIAEEQAFVGRAGVAGDDLGSRVIAARLVRDVMRLAFLVEGQYAPYPKWLGAAFARLPCAPDLSPLLFRVLDSTEWPAREAALAEAYLSVARLHGERKLPGVFEPALHSFHDRPFRVINADAIAAAIRAEIADPVLRAVPLIGALDQVTDATPLVESPQLARAAMAALFDDGEPRLLEES